MGAAATGGMVKANLPPPPPPSTANVWAPVSARAPGGSGTWSTTSPTWTAANGDGPMAMSPQPGFAVFEGTPGTATVDGGAGGASATGMQFVVGAYTLTGGVGTLAGSGGAAPSIEVRTTHPAVRALRRRSTTSWLVSTDWPRMIPARWCWTEPIRIPAVPRSIQVRCRSATAPPTGRSSAMSQTMVRWCSDARASALSSHFEDVISGRTGTGVWYGDLGWLAGQPAAQQVQRRDVPQRRRHRRCRQAHRRARTAGLRGGAAHGAWISQMRMPLGAWRRASWWCIPSRASRSADRRAGARTSD